MNALTLASVACLTTLLLPGCYAFTSLGRARVLDPGKLEVFVAPEVYAVASGGGATVRPTGEVGARYGVVPGLDLGARITTLGFTLTSRVQLHRSSVPVGGIDVALAPGFAFTASDKLALELPVLVGISIREHQVVLAPRLVYQMRVGIGGQDAPAHFLYAGGSIGVALRVDAHVSLLPEIAFLTQVYADPGFSTNLAGALGMQAALGILFDI